MNNIFKYYTDKLGVSKSNIIQLAEENFRLCELEIDYKFSASIIPNKNTLYIICLDLASRFHGDPLDQKTLITYSGLTKAKYLKAFSMAHSILNKDNDPELLFDKFILINGYSHVKSLADEILETCCKCEEKGLRSIDLKIGAFYLASKELKVNINKDKFYEIHKLTNSTFNQLIKYMNDIYSASKENQTNSINLNEETQKNEQVEEDYETWKNRILQSSKSQ